MVINDEGKVTLIEEKDIDSSGELFFPDEAIRIEADMVRNHVSSKTEKILVKVNFNKVMSIVGRFVEILSIGAQSVKEIWAPYLKEAYPYLFECCNKLEKVKLDSAKILGQASFRRCPKLKEVDCPCVEAVRERAFEGCGRLSSFAFPESIRNIGAYAFYHSGIKSVEIPKGAILNGAAFQNATLLETVRMHSLKQLNEQALLEPFKGCVSLRQIQLDEMTPRDRYPSTKAGHGYDVICGKKHKKIFCFAENNNTGKDIVEVSQVIEDVDMGKFIVCVLLDGTYRICSKDKISTVIQDIAELKKWIQSNAKD